MAFEASRNDYLMLFQRDCCPKISNILAGNLKSIEL
jgi:hypothetical protein